MDDLKIPKTLTAKVRLQAADTGVDPEWLTEQALRIIADMPAGLLGALLNIREALSATFNEDVPLHVVVANRLTDQLAWYAARERAGLVVNRPLFEFARTKDGKFVTGEPLLQLLVDQYQREIEDARAGWLLWKRQHGPLTKQEEDYLNERIKPDPAMQEIRQKIAQAKAEGKEVVLGEVECCRCGAELDPPHDLRVERPSWPPVTMRLCKQCADHVDVTYGILARVHGRGGEEAKVKT